MPTLNNYDENSARLGSAQLVGFCFVLFSTIVDAATTDTTNKSLADDESGDESGARGSSFLSSLFSFILSGSFLPSSDVVGWKSLLHVRRDANCRVVLELEKTLSASPILLRI